MMVRLIALSVGALGLMALSPQNQLPTFTVTSPQGQYDGWQGSTQGYVALRTRVEALALGPYGKWASGVAVSIGDDHRLVWLKAYSYGEGLPFEIKAQLLVDEQTVNEAPFQMILDPAQPFDFELRWTSDGEVCLSVKQAGTRESRMLAIGARPSVMSLIGSSGSFRFEAIDQVALPPGRDRAAVDATVKAGCVPIS